MRRVKPKAASKSTALGVGIVGTGDVAGAHIDNFAKVGGCEVVAVLSRRPERAAAKIAAHALTRAEPYSDLGRFLAHPGLDVVVIATPHPNHPAETIAAARAGKHVVIEKPVALDRASLGKMLAAVERAGVVTSVSFELRWIGLFRNVKAIVEKGLLGEIFHAQCGYHHGIGPWIPQWSWNVKKSMAGSALLTAGCHALDGLIHLVGQRVTEVAAMSGRSRENPLRYEYDPNAAALLRFEGGALAGVSTSIECRQPYLFPLLVQGTRGTVWNDRLSTVDFPALDGWAHLPADLPESGSVKDHPYLGQLREFVAAVREGRRASNDLRSCAHVHEVMFAVEEAIRARRTVRVKRTPGE